MIARDYLRGLRSQADVAAELGISVRQLQRIEEIALARLVVGVCRAIRREIGDLAPDENPCRISPNRPEHGLAPAHHVLASSPVGGRGARAASQKQEPLPMTATAESLVLSLEAEGTPSAESIAAARAAVAAELAAIEAKVFPTNIPPVSADAIKAYEFHTGRLSLARFGDGMADLHRRSLDEHPELALMLRTADPALADVAAAAARPGASGAGSAAVRAYQRQVTIALVEDCDAPSDARTFLATIALEDRLAAVEARAEQHAAAEAGRVAEAARAEVRAKRDERKARIAEAAQAEQTARAGYETAVRTHQRIRAESLRERVAASGLTEIRDHLGRLWATKDLLFVAADGTAELPPHYELGVLERALDKYEASEAP